jgi:DinB superfamily
MEIIDYFERVRARTMRVVACVPPSSIDWTYRAGKFTLGDLIRHLASIERWMFAENAQRKPSRYPGHGRELADGYDAAIAYMREMHEQSMSIFRSLTEADLDAKCMTPGDAELTVRKWFFPLWETARSDARGELGADAVATTPSCAQRAELRRPRSHRRRPIPEC